MKRVLALLSVMLVAVCAFGQGIQFEEKLSWDQILVKAKKEGKPIFIDFYTTWCVPCKEMDIIYQDGNVGASFNSQVISLKVQLDKTTNDSKRIQSWYRDAEKLEKSYKITSYPTLVFLSADGKLLRKITGVRTADHLIWEWQKALSPGIEEFRPQPILNFDTLVSQYRKGSLDKKLMRELAVRAELDAPKNSENKMLAKEIADSIINNLPEDSLYTRDNIWLLFTFTRKLTDRGFKIFKDHADKVLEAAIKSKSTVTKEHIDFVVPSILYREEVLPYLSAINNHPDWTKIEVNLKKYGKSGKETLKQYRDFIIAKSSIAPYRKSLNGKPDWKVIKENLTIYGAKGEAHFLAEQVMYYAEIREWDSLYKAGEQFIEKYPKETSLIGGAAANNIAWGFFNHRDSREYTVLALKFAKMAIADEPKEAIYQDTYANLLYKLGQKEKAIKYQAWIITLPTAGLDIKENYRKMKAGEKTWDPKNW